MKWTDGTSAKRRIKPIELWLSPTTPQLKVPVKICMEVKTQAFGEKINSRTIWLNRLQCFLLCVNHGCAEQKLLLLLLLLASFLVWKRKHQRGREQVLEQTQTQTIYMFFICSQLIQRWRTWVDHRLRRRRSTAVQLQQSLLDGLAEGVLEAGHGDSVRAVALSIAVCCRRSQQLICTATRHRTDWRRPSGSHTVQQPLTTNWFYRKCVVTHEAPVTSPTQLLKSATCINWHINKSRRIQTQMFVWNQQPHRSFNTWGCWVSGC